MARRRRPRLAITAVTTILGLLVIAQLRSQGAVPGLSGLSAQELTVLVANVNSRNAQLRTEVANLERQLANLAASQDRGESAVDALRADLARIRTWAGLVRVAGPGVTISVSGQISAHAIRDLVNELRNVGAEAISIGGVRVVAGTVVAVAPGGLSLDGSALSDPFDIVAIGSPQTLTGALTRTGGVVAQIGATEPAARLTVTPGERVEVPATERELVPRHGRPRL